MDRIRARIRYAVEAALDKKAIDLDVLEVAGLTSIADFFIICSGTTERQTHAIADAIDARIKQEDGINPQLVEGTTTGRWILIDYGDFIVHIFTEDCRRFYGLERLWGDAPNVTASFGPADAATRLPRAKAPARSTARKPAATRTPAKAQSERKR